MPDQTDYYKPDDAAEETPATTPDSKAKPDEEKQTEAKSALLPKYLFPGEPPTPGDVCSFKVEHVFEDEVEVSYLKDGDKTKPTNERSTMDTATEAFDEMANPAGKEQ